MLPGKIPLSWACLMVITAVLRERSPTFGVPYTDPPCHSGVLKDDAIQQLHQVMLRTVVSMGISVFRSSFNLFLRLAEVVTIGERYEFKATRRSTFRVYFVI